MPVLRSLNYSARIQYFGNRVYGASMPVLLAFMKLIARTSRTVSEPNDYIDRALARKPVILAFWHGQTFITPMLFPWHELPTYAVVADNTAGEPLANALARLGLNLIRGRGANWRGVDRGGAQVVRASISVLKNGFSVAMTADGPSEPHRRCGRGVIQIARHSGRPIVPFAVATSNFATVRRRTYTVNLPFSRLGVAMAEPIFVPANANATEQEDIRLSVERALDDVTRRAYALAGADCARATPPIVPNVTADPMREILLPKAYWAARPASAEETMFAKPSAVVRLGRCLSFDSKPPMLGPLRAELFSDPSAWAGLFNIAGNAGLMAALGIQLLEKALVPPAALTHERGVRPPATIIHEYLASHERRREVMREHLFAVTRGLNARGIEPVLIKGAASLWADADKWRHLVDLDLLVAPDAAEAAQQAIIDLGYHPQPNHRVRWHNHHLAPLLRSDYPGSIEVHRRAGHRFAESFLPTNELLRETSVSIVDGARARILPEPLNALFGLVHHHIGHSEDARGTLNIKGLYEFAAGIQSLSANDLSNLQRRASTNVRLVAALDYWIAAAADWLSMPVPANFALYSDAETRWRKVKAHLEGAPKSWKYPGYEEEIRMAWSPQRIGRSVSGSSWAGRQVARARVVGSLLPRLPISKEHLPLRF